MWVAKVRGGGGGGGGWEVRAPAPKPQNPPRPRDTAAQYQTGELASSVGFFFFIPS